MARAELLSGIGTFYRSSTKVVVEREAGTTPTIQPLQNTNNDENSSPANKRNKDANAPIETRHQVLTEQSVQNAPETPAATIRTLLKYNCLPSESLRVESQALLNRDIIHHNFSAESPDKEPNCCA